MRHLKCSHQGCLTQAHEVYDWYGIYAGRWCDEHKAEAPGQWPYAADGDIEPLDEEE